MDRRTLGILLSVAGVAMLLVGSLSRSWWTAGDGNGSMRIGLRETEVCLGDECKTERFQSVPELVEREKAWVTLGSVSFYGGFLAAIALVCAAFLGLARKYVAGMVSPTKMGVSLSLVALVAAVGFLVLQPEELGMVGLSMGFGFPVYAAGALLGATGAGLLSSPSVYGMLGMKPGFVVSAPPPPAAALPPTEPPPQASAAPTAEGAPIPACPRCQRTMRWVPEHRRFYCDSCQQYL